MNSISRSTVLIILLMLTISGGCCGKGTPGAADIYEPLLPDEVIFSAPTQFLNDYFKLSCQLELVRGEKPSQECKEAFPRPYTH